MYIVILYVFILYTHALHCITFSILHSFWYFRDYISSYCLILYYLFSYVHAWVHTTFCNHPRRKIYSSQMVEKGGQWNVAARQNHGSHMEPWRGGISSCQMMPNMGVSIVMGVGLMSHFGDLFHITTTSICWKLYPQYLGDVQLGHLPTPAIVMGVPK